MGRRLKASCRDVPVPRRPEDAYPDVLAVLMLPVQRFRVLSMSVLRLPVLSVPYSKSRIVPRSSLLGAGQLGFWEVGKGGTIG